MCRPPCASQEKWRLALTLLRHVRASGIRVTGVLADAEFGDKRVFRGLLHRLRLPYAVGVSSHLTAFVGTPRLTHPRTLPRLAPTTTGGRRHRAADRRGDRGGAAAWRRVHWRNRLARAATPPTCTAIRVTPALDYRHPRLLPEIWLLAERDVGLSPKTRFFYVNLPATASLAAFVRFAHQRWPIEQQYQELKSELGLDHFEGRTYPGWHHHVVLTAIAYNFLQSGAPARPPHTDIPDGPWPRPRDLHRLSVCAAASLPQTNRGAQVGATPDLTK